MPNLNALLRERKKNCNSVLTWIVANNYFLYFFSQIFGQTREMSTIQITIDQNSIKSRIAILFATFRKLFKQLFWYHFVMLKSNIRSFRFDTSERKKPQFEPHFFFHCMRLFYDEFHNAKQKLPYFERFFCFIVHTHTNTNLYLYNRWKYKHVFVVFWFWFVFRFHLVFVNRILAINIVGLSFDDMFVNCW